MSFTSSPKQVSTAYWNTLSSDEKLTRIREGYAPISQTYTSPTLATSELSQWNSLSTDEKLLKIRLGTEPKLYENYISNAILDNEMKLANLRSSTYTNTTLWDLMSTEEKLLRINSGIQPTSSSIHYSPVTTFSASYELEKSQLNKIEECKNERATQLSKIDDLQQQIELEKTNKHLKESEYDQSIRNARVLKVIEEKNINDKLNETKIMRDVNTSQLDASMSAQVSSPIKTSNLPAQTALQNPYYHARVAENERMQLSNINNIQNEREINASRMNQLEVEKFTVSRGNETKINELEINKSLTLKSSDNSLNMLENNLELAKRNKRRNSLELENAVSTHQNSPFKYSSYIPYSSYQFDVNNTITKSRTEDIKRRLDLEQSIKSPMKNVNFITPAKSSIYL